MNRWIHRLDVGDVFHNDDLTFPEKRDEMVRRIRALPIISTRLSDIADNLAAAETPDEWDDPWDDFYDYADERRIWVATWPRAVTR